ncbi:Photosynthetic NDH subunit of subcomplex B 2, chloroplastic [Linum perenne]
MASLVSFSVPKPGIVRATSLSTTTSIPTTSDSGSTLEEKFGRKGIKFSESNNNVPLVELTVRNGSSLKLQIPDAHITSYLPKVYWKDDGFEEILYTIPPTGDGKKSKGGIGLVVYDHVSSSSKPTLVTDSEWSVKGVDSDAIDAVQVELECTTGKLEMTYVVTLYPVSIATAVIVKNNGVKPVTLTSAILKIITPDEAMKPDSPGLFDFFFEPEEKPGLSRIYAAPPEERLKRFYNTPPSKFETLDQVGKELFFRVIRMGDFEDIYLSSPGPFSEKYGDQKHHFICTGPAAMLVPVVVEPGEDWRGAQVIEHDNL